MTKKLSILGAAVVAALALGSAGNASAHAVSIGYANAGAGSVTVWLGTYSTGHAAPVLEGSLNLVGVLGNPFASTTSLFNLLTGTGAAFKPAGLIDGTTNFYAPGGTGALVGSELLFNTVGCPGCGPVDHWQGVTFSGLGAGSYQFTYVPIGSPTQQWDIFNPNMNGIFDLTGVINPTPEPGSLALVGLAILGLAAAQRRRAA